MISKLKEVVITELRRMSEEDFIGRCVMISVYILLTVALSIILVKMLVDAPVFLFTIVGAVCAIMWAARSIPALITHLDSKDSSDSKDLSGWWNASNCSECKRAFAPGDTRTGWCDVSVVESNTPPPILCDDCVERFRDSGRGEGLQSVHPTYSGVMVKGQQYGWDNRPERRYGP